MRSTAQRAQRTGTTETFYEESKKPGEQELPVPVRRGGLAFSLFLPSYPRVVRIRAYDYVEIFIAVEKELRARGHEHVLLVPAMGD